MGAVGDHGLGETQLPAVYRDGIRPGKAGAAQVDIHPGSNHHLDGIAGTAPGPDAANPLHNLGKINLRRGAQPEAKIGSPPGLVHGACTADQGLAGGAAIIDTGPAGQPPLRHGHAVAAGRARQRRDQPGGTAANDHQIIVAAGWVLPVRRVAMIDGALVECILSNNSTFMGSIPFNFFEIFPLQGTF
jgi:hypothetical protein